MVLSRYERESIISFNEADNKVCIYTASEPVRNKLLKLGFKPVNTIKSAYREIAWEFEIFKSKFRWGLKREMSEEQRKIASVRAKANFKRKAATLAQALKQTADSTVTAKYVAHTGGIQATEPIPVISLHKRGRPPKLPIT